MRFTAGEGFADLFEDLKEDDAAVGIRNAGGGPLFTGSSTALTSSIRIDADSSARIGDLSGSGGNPVAGSFSCMTFKRGS